jgi:pseudaminic acid cytidylyltransferase
MHTVAIIPARAGSKRIPNKNIKPFAGKPVIAHSIQALQEAGVFDRILVSTDSEAIAAVARECGAEVPFMRPKELSDDHTPTAPVLLHALRFLVDGGYSVAYVCCLYAAAPLVQAGFIRQGFALIRQHNIGSVFSVASFEFPIFRAMKINEQGYLEMFWPEHELTRSQDLPAAYHDAGQFYWLDAARFLKKPCVYTPDAMPVMIPRYLVQDIDTPEDWERAEFMHHALAAAEASRKTTS